MVARGVISLSRSRETRDFALTEVSFIDLPVLDLLLREIHESQLLATPNSTYKHTTGHLTDSTYINLLVLLNQSQLRHVFPPSMFPDCGIEGVAPTIDQLYNTTPPTVSGGRTEQDNTLVSTFRGWTPEVIYSIGNDHEYIRNKRASTHRWGSPKSWNTT